MNGRHLTFWEYAHRYPPILCRLLARHKNGPPMTIEEIADRGELSNLEVILMSQHTSWDTVPLEAMHRFLVGCGMDFCNGRQVYRARQYTHHVVKGSLAFAYLRKSQQWTQTYEPMLKRYLQSLVTAQRRA